MMSRSSTLETGHEFVTALCEEARNHRAVNHPYLQQLIAGDVPDIKGALKDFVFQYSAYSMDFIRYLTATIAQLERGEHRKALMKNLVEETGKIDAENAALLGTIGIDLEWVDGISHPELFSRYMNAAGIDKEFLRNNQYADEAVVWRDLFFSLCSKEGPTRALGAIGLGTENIVKYIYRPFIKAIERHLDISLRDRVFFDLHAALDDQHGEALTNIAIDYAENWEHRKQIRDGMHMALSIRNAFFDALQAKALAMKPT
ncbi:MAG: iron-containing redox enzyme family protein [Sideroxyarcus sp.]|nr:iron-containing redox enzyme family protein [Sideroxyarcus sp.]